MLYYFIMSKLATGVPVEDDKKVDKKDEEEVRREPDRQGYENFVSRDIQHTINIPNTSILSTGHLTFYEL